MELHHLAQLVRVHAPPAHLRSVHAFRVFEEEILGHGSGRAQRPSKLDQVVAFAGTDGRLDIEERTVCAGTGWSGLTSKQDFFQRLKLWPVCFRQPCRIVPDTACDGGCRECFVRMPDTRLQRVKQGIACAFGND